MVLFSTSGIYASVVSSAVGSAFQFSVVRNPFAAVGEL